MKLKYILLLLCCLALIPLNLEAANVAPTIPMASTNFKVQGIFPSALGNAGTPNKMSSSRVFVPEGSFDGIADTRQLLERAEVKVLVGGVDAADAIMLKGFSGFPGFFPGVSPTDVPYNLQTMQPLSAPNVFYLPYDGKGNQIRYVLTGYTGTGGLSSGSASGGMITTVTPASPLSLASTITWNYQKQVRVSVTTYGEDFELKLYDVAGDTTAGSAVVTRLASTSGLTVGMLVFGNGIPDGVTITAVNTLTGTVTLSTAATRTFTQSAGQRLTFAPGWINRKGDTTAGSATVANIASTTGLTVGMLVNGGGIAAGTTVTAVTASSVTLSAVATQTALQNGLTFAQAPVLLSIKGNLTTDNATVTNLESTAGLTVGMMIYGNGIPTGATITSVNTSGSAVTMSAKATQTVTQGGLVFASSPGASYSDPRECAGSDSVTCTANSSAPYSGVHFYDASDTSSVVVTAKQSFTDYPSGTIRTLTQVFVSGGATASPVQLLQSGRKVSISAGMKTPMEVEWRYNTTLAFTLGKPVDPTPSNVPALKSVDFNIKPQITILAADATLPGDTVDTAFVWGWDNSIPDAQRMKYFPIHPIGSFSIRWTCTDGSTFDETGKTVWPAKQKHISGVPANLQPPGAVNTFNSVSYTTSGATATLAEFTTASAGITVLRFNTPPVEPYLITGTAFIVVQSEEKPSNDQLTKLPWNIGSKITDLSHTDPESASRTGYLYYNGGVYDGAGADRAYDRSTRRGAIIPVNVTPAGDTNPLVVVWYETGQGGIGWPTTVIRYTPEWPIKPPEIIIGTGIAVLESTRPRAMVYNQPLDTLPGQNPNEEHALLSGGMLYALRNDLNEVSEVKSLSKPYVLLKYFNTAAGEWMMDVYKVIRPKFEYTVEVGGGGAPINPPLPESFQVPPVSDIKRVGTIEAGGEWHLKDRNNSHWAKAANWKDGDSITEISKSKFVMQWYYYMRADFYWPFGGSRAKKEGDVLPFLNNNGSDTNNVSPYVDGAAPIDVTYITKWPATVATLPVGNTLTVAVDAGSGKPLPNLYDFMAAEVVFDENVYNGKSPLAKLYAPERYLYAPLAAIPAGIRTETGIGGMLTFPELPYAIQARLFYDTTNKRLGFKGTWIANEGEDPWLLPNLMTAAERETIKSFVTAASASVEWKGAADALYALGRNPGGVSAVTPQMVVNPYDATKSFALEYDSVNGVWTGIWGAPLGLQVLNGNVTSTRNVGGKNALTAGMAQMAKDEAYVVIAENHGNDLAIVNLPIKLHVIKIIKSPVFQGVIKAIKSKNVFDEKLTLHYTGDFGGEPEKFYFEWYYQPVLGSKPNLPDSGPAIGDWQKFIVPENTTGRGQTDITIQGASNLTLSDNWVVARYYYGNAWPKPISADPLPIAPDYLPADPAINWSAWSGSNTKDTPMLAMGWIKRVIDGLNPLEARVTDFRNSATNTTVSMLSQFGGRYAGDIAFSSDPNYLNSLGLISVYETVLNRGRAFSIDANPQPTPYAPTSDALLNISSRLATFYLALGNEAYADAVDPTIGYSTKSGEYGNMAPSVFAFQNQVDSLLEEELALMRGRDDSGGSTKNEPYYNRLIWNFTQGEGEVAYAQNYNITDQVVPKETENGLENGIVNAADAKVMYPQGHGDAWGHYLQAINYYYKLLGNSVFNWEPRVEYVLVAGQAILVDYLDERKFASIAATRAKTGAEILDLTYKKLYTDDPAGQWQGYKDTDTSRAWGVDEWARRAGQGAYFDWLTANAVLPPPPAENAPNPVRYKYEEDAVSKTLIKVEITGGIQQIDRTRVPELTGIASQFHKMQSKMSEVDSGINPLGLVKGVVPFDIDPAQVDAGQTHFEQVYQRAEKALANAIVAYDYANGYTQRLRQNQDTLDDFKKNLTDQERDYTNRLIEIFGYPYGDDIGSGKTYPDGYLGPDIFHYNIIERTDLTGSKPLDAIEYKTYAVDYKLPSDFWSLGLANYSIDGGTTQTVKYTINSQDNWIEKDPTWTTKRRAPGRIQQALSDMVQSKAAYDKAFKEYESQLAGIEDAKSNLEERYGVLANQITLQDINEGLQIGLDVAVNALHLQGLIFKRLSSVVRDTADSALEAIPKVVGVATDATAPIRGVAKGLTVGLHTALDVAGDAMDMVEFSMGTTKDRLQAGMELKLAKSDASYEVSQLVKELQNSMSGLDLKLMELYTLQESFQQVVGTYQATMAEGLRLIDERTEKRTQSAADVQAYRFQDLGFRVFRNDAIQKYRAQFDLAAKYVYLAATAYDYETNLLGTASGAGRKFLGEIARQSSLGVVINGIPQAGFLGLADVMARLKQNFDVYKTQLGFNNPQTETTPFSLRTELFRIKADASSKEDWKNVLKDHLVPDLWKIPEFKRYCRPFANESAGAQPGIVIKFPTTITYGKNFFGWPLSGGDSAYSTSNFATRVRSVGLWFQNYNNAGLSNTPRVYLVPTGADVLRSPTGDGFSTREWQVKDQKLPVPLLIGGTDLTNPSFIPNNDSLSDEMSGIRRVSDFRAYPYNGVFDPGQTSTDSRLIGRSVWNTQWMLIIPGSTLLFNKDVGLNTFINSVDDIKMFFQTYAYSGN